MMKKIQTVLLAASVKKEKIMTQKDMVKHAREGNLVKFGRAFKTAIQEKIPAVIETERARVANILFNQRGDQ